MGSLLTVATVRNLPNLVMQAQQMAMLMAPMTPMAQEIFRDRTMLHLPTPAPSPRQKPSAGDSAQLLPIGNYGFLAPLR